MQQISPPAPAWERVARITVNTIGPTRGPVRTRAVVITQLPRGVCDVHAPEMSLPRSVQLGGAGPMYTSASQPTPLAFAGTFSGAPTVTAPRGRGRGQREPTTTSAVPSLRAMAIQRTPVSGSPLYGR